MGGKRHKSLAHYTKIHGVLKIREYLLEYNRAQNLITKYHNESQYRKPGFMNKAIRPKKETQEFRLTISL